MVHAQRSQLRALRRVESAVLTRREVMILRDGLLPWHSGVGNDPAVRRWVGIRSDADRRQSVGTRRYSAALEALCHRLVPPAARSCARAAGVTDRRWRHVV